MGWQNFLKRKLNEIELMVLQMDSKRRGIFLDWLPRHNKFVKTEKTYDYSTHIVYRRGMVLHVDFGFRVGAEYGGFHWAVVIQNDSKKAQTIVVVPLSSLKEGQETYHKDAFLGLIDNFNENEAEALLGQITTISKMRIQPGTIYKLNNDQMDEIDKKIIGRYVKPALQHKLL